MSNEEQSPVVWSPSEDTLANSRMGQFKAWLEQQGFGPFADYHALHQWSIDELETFWQKVWDYCGLVCDTPAERVLGKHEMPGAEWFPGMKLNFAANLLRLADGSLLLCTRQLSAECPLHLGDELVVRNGLPILVFTHRFGITH